jgi:hypothetical protein
MIPEEAFLSHVCRNKIISNDTRDTHNTHNTHDTHDIKIKIKHETVSKKIKHSKMDARSSMETRGTLTDNILNQVQLEVMRKCRLKAKIYHTNVYQNSLIRFIQLGYTEDDLKSALYYLKNIDLIVHFGKREPPSWLVSDTQLRNTFEINNYVNGGDGCRKEWEDNLFFKLYTHDCDSSSRVKYGCLNLLNDPEGCRSAHGYGISYMILKENVKQRTTFVCGDSAGMQQHICTFLHCAQLLLYMHELLLINVINIANKKEEEPQLDINTNIHIINYVYIEAQIHGDVIFLRDISKIVLHHSHATHEIVGHLERIGIPYDIIYV